MRKIVAIAMIVLGLLSIASPVLACVPPPTVTDCWELGSGYRMGFRVFQPVEKTYYLTGRYGYLIGGAVADPDDYVKFSKMTSSSFSWSASLGIDAVIVQSGTTKTVKKYDEKKSSSISFAGSRVDKVIFCYDYELDLSRTTQGTIEGPSTWHITKTPSPAEQVQLAGADAKFDYTVAVNKQTGGEKFTYATTVTFSNNTPMDATVISITDLLQPGNIPVPLNCGIRAYPYTLAAGKSITCTGSVELKAKLDGIDWVRIQTAGTGAVVWGRTGNKTITWKTVAPTSDSITVTDTHEAFGGPYTVDKDTTWNYAVNYTCPADPAGYANGPQKFTYDNDAVIQETDECACTKVNLTCYQLDVTTSAKGTPVGGITWDITKDVDLLEQVKFAGEKATFNYTVGVKQNGTISGYNVASLVEIKNNTPLDAQITGITDLLKPGDTPVALDCGVSFPYTLKSSQTLTCNGSTSLQTKLEGGYNWVQVQTSNVLTASGDIAWDTTASQVTAPSTITVTDTNANFKGPQSASGDKTWTYPVELACPVEQAAYTNGKAEVTKDNTATITETGKSASKSVKLTCYAPTVSTTNSGFSELTHEWEILKTSSVNQTDGLKVEIGQVGIADYTVTVNEIGVTPGNISLGGDVTVTNPNPTPGSALTVTVTDEFAPGLLATFPVGSCTDTDTDTLTLTLQPGESKTCYFEAYPAEVPTGQNQVHVAFNSLNWTSAVDYNWVKDDVDECVTVTDVTDVAGQTLGTVCAPDKSKQFTYTLQIPSYDTCGKKWFKNYASLVGNDTGTRKTTQYSIPIFVNCAIMTNCTKPYSYWVKTIDKDDITKALDPTWTKLPNGPVTPFYASGQTWAEMLLASSSGENSTYVQLAQAYITAQLNVSFGAKPPTVVVNAIAHANDVLNQYSAPADQLTVTGTVADDFRATTVILNAFNLGDGEPGKCPNCQY